MTENYHKPMKTNKNILIRDLTEEDNAILCELRTLTGMKTNSQAILKVLRNYLTIKQDLETVIDEFLSFKDTAMQEIDKLNSVRDAMGVGRERFCRRKIVIENGMRRI
jgi:hypothetical protein